MWRVEESKQREGRGKSSIERKRSTRCARRRDPTHLETSVERVLLDACHFPRVVIAERVRRDRLASRRCVSDRRRAHLRELSRLRRSCGNHTLQTIALRLELSIHHGVVAVATHVRRSGRGCAPKISTPTRLTRSHRKGGRWGDLRRWRIA